MASDRQKFNKAIQKWNALHAEGAYSAPVDLGRAAIFVTNEGYGETEADQDFTLGYMQDEARNLAANFSDFYADIEIHTSITFDNIKGAIQDPEVSGIIIVGEGNLAMIFNNTNDDKIRWSHISNWSKHLKQGVFFQRFCGNIPASVPVPFGTFAMSSLSSVWAAVGKTFQPEYDKNIENYFLPVSNADMLSYEEVHDTFGDPRALKAAQQGVLATGLEVLRGSAQYVLPFNQSPQGCSSAGTPLLSLRSALNTHN